MTISDWAKKHDLHIALGSGFFSFFAHAGFYKALHESFISPTSLSGSSAGAIIAALWASEVPPAKVEAILNELERKDFWDPRFGFGLLKGKLFNELLRKVIPIESFENLKIPLHVSAFNLSQLRTHSINSGLISDAVQASCAIPFCFHPVKINRHLFVDGGLFDEFGISELNSSQRLLIHKIGNKNIKSNHLLTKKKFSEVKIISLNSLPFVHPFKLSSGQIAYKKAYEQTMKYLNSKF